MGKSVAIIATIIALAGAASAQGEGFHWYKGNTHTHTTMSDGDSTPGLVARWYRNNGYDFLFLTDHNIRTEIDELQREIDEENQQAQRKPFLLIHGEEVSNNLSREQRRYAVHTAGLDTKTTVGKQEGNTVQELLQKSVDGIIAAGGRPSVNHPNFLWSLTTDDLFAIKRLRHYEIYNGHPQVNGSGGGGVPSTEHMWDQLLTRGKNIFGVAVDDAHHYKEFRRDLSNPGRGWVVVRARALDTENIMQGLTTGDFYASTGVSLDDLSTTPGKGIALAIRPHRNEKFSTEFIGRDGKILKTDITMNPSYDLKPDDLYVRAKVTASSGDHAWTQPVYLVEPEADPEDHPEDPATSHSHNGRGYHKH